MARRRVEKRASWFWDWQQSKRTKINDGCTRAVRPSLSTMHRRMHDLCALLNPILVDSANLVPDHRLFRARDQTAGPRRPALIYPGPVSFTRRVATRTKEERFDRERFTFSTALNTRIRFSPANFWMSFSDHPRANNSANSSGYLLTSSRPFGVLKHSGQQSDYPPNVWYNSLTEFLAERPFLDLPVSLCHGETASDKKLFSPGRCEELVQAPGSVFT